MAAKVSSLILGLFVLADLTVEQHGQDAPIPAATVGVQRYQCPGWVCAVLQRPRQCPWRVQLRWRAANLAEPSPNYS